MLGPGMHGTGTGMGTTQYRYVVRDSNPVKGIFSSSKKDFSVIIETAVSLIVSHLMAWDPCASSPNITMKACA